MLQRTSTPDPEREEAYRLSGHWADATLGSVFQQHVRRDPNHVAVVDRAGSITYGKLEHAVARCAGLLRALGVEPGDVVSIQLPNWREFVVAHLATERLGAVTNPLLPQYREHELTMMQGILKARVAITAREFRGHSYGPMWERVRVATEHPPHVVEVVDPRRPAEGTFWSQLESSTPVGPDEVDQRGDDVTVVLFTSGTVRAKGVMHTHDTMLYGLREYQRWLELDPTMVLWMPSPISHATGLQWGVRTAVYVGGTLVLQEHWDPHEALRLVELTGATHTIGATAFVHDLLVATDDQGDPLATLRIFACAGAPIPESIAVEARERLGFEVLRAYGMTEHFISTICHPTDQEEKRRRTDGRCLPGTEITVFDEERENQLPVGAVGELAVRGPGVSLGYLGEPEATEATYRSDGWQLTEDLARIDDDGFVQVLGRRKDLIIRGGLNVSPAEIEALLLTLPAVQAVSVVGVPDARLGERICAVVVPRAGAEVTLSDLTKHLLSQGVTKLKLPELLELQSDLPRTASGKIRKDVLRERLAGADA